LLARRDADGVIRKYAHLGTGNYNSLTARTYTDLSLLTADEKLTEGANRVFSFLTAYSEHADYSPLMVSPLDFAKQSIALINRETTNAMQGKPARMIAKMNGLLDKPIIEALYRASGAGVNIDLIVRGMCALRPGVRGLSENIRVRSIVGRFLEHSRIFYFENGGNPEVFLGSADWMPRNLYDRVEVLFPVREAELRERVVREILSAYIADNMKSRILQANGAYRRAGHGQRKKPGTGSIPRFNAQEHLIDLAEKKCPPQGTVEAARFQSLAQGKAQ